MAVQQEVQMAKADKQVKEETVEKKEEQVAQVKDVEKEKVKVDPLEEVKKLKEEVDRIKTETQSRINELTREKEELRNKAEAKPVEKKFPDDYSDQELDSIATNPRAWGVTDEEQVVKYANQANREIGKREALKAVKNELKERDKPIEKAKYWQAAQKYSNKGFGNLNDVNSAIRKKAESIFAALPAKDKEDPRAHLICVQAAYSELASPEIERLKSESDRSSKNLGAEGAKQGLDSGRSVILENKPQRKLEELEAKVAEGQGVEAVNLFLRAKKEAEKER